MKTYNLQSNIGSARYVVNFHDGIKRHEDGSAFFDIKLFSNAKERNNFITKLLQEGYKQESELSIA